MPGGYPAVQLWNRSLLRNLSYATEPGQQPALPLDRLLTDADLDSVLSLLPDGLRTSLGEGGALVSGGEGQRVRLGRALFPPDTRLAVLDEPFRGLDHATRRRLLARARRLWSQATLLCVTHDIAEVDVFPRVLVVEGGRVVEDGSPAELLTRSDSRYGELVSRFSDPLGIGSVPSLALAAFASPAMCKASVRPPALSNLMFATW